MASGAFGISLPWLAATVVLGFLIGSIPFGLIVGRLFYHTDIRGSGSGNIGAANALRTFGKAGAFAVLVLDALKGFTPAEAWLVAIHWYTVALVPAALGGLAALLGHCYSPWLHFRGGKGVATHLGVLFALSWPVGLLFIGVWALAALSTGYSSAGSLLATLVSAVALWFAAGPAGLAYGVAAALVIFWRHRENIARLRAGTENSMSLVKKRKSA